MKEPITLKCDKCGHVEHYKHEEDLFQDGKMWGSLDFKNTLCNKCFNMDTLKDRLRQHFEEQVHDVDQEEIDNTIEVLESLEDDLSDLDKWSEQLLLRMINDTELFQEVDDLYEEDFDDDIFDEFD